MYTKKKTYVHKIPFFEIAQARYKMLPSLTTNKKKQTRACGDDPPKTAAVAAVSPAPRTTMPSIPSPTEKTNSRLRAFEAKLVGLRRGRRCCWWQPEIRDQLTSWGKGSWNPIFYQSFKNIPGGCLGFLNHQQYHIFFFENIWIYIMILTLQLSIVGGCLTIVRQWFFSFQKDSRSQEANFTERLLRNNKADKKWSVTTCRRQSSSMLDWRSGFPLKWQANVTNSTEWSEDRTL